MKGDKICEILILMRIYWEDAKETGNISHDNYTDGTQIWEGRLGAIWISQQNCWETIFTSQVTSQEQTAAISQEVHPVFDVDNSHCY